MKSAPWIVLGVVATAMVAIAFVRNRHEDAPAQPALSSQVAGASTLAARTDVRPARAPRRALPSSKEIAQAREERVRSLDARLLEEARDAKWAADNERNIDAFFTAENLRKAGVPPVSSHDVECRSQLCRVRMRVDSDLGSDQATQALLQHMAQSLPSAQIFQTDDAKGASIVVYAESQAPAPANGNGFKRPRR